MFQKEKKCQQITEVLANSPNFFLKNAILNKRLIIFIGEELEKGITPQEQLQDLQKK